MNIYDFIQKEEQEFKTKRVPVTESFDWNFYEHINRCTNVANAWFSSGKNYDGSRPYKDIVTPILNVALRSRGFDVKDIVPFVNSAEDYYKSFLVKKYHPQWARKYNLDTLIDEVVYNSTVYDFVLVKNVNEVKPIVVAPQQIAFCDQVDANSGPICLKYAYSTSELLSFKGAWDSDAIDNVIIQAKNQEVSFLSGDKKVDSPSKKIEVYELHINDTEDKVIDGGDPSKYVNQLHIVTFYKDKDNNKTGVTLFKGVERKSPLRVFVSNPVFGRAAGRSFIESLFEPQLWANYSEIKIKQMLDAAALVLYQSDSDELANQDLNKIKNNRILKHETGKPLTLVNNQAINLPNVVNHQIRQENGARIIGSASDAQLGTNPVSGTPFALQNLIVQQGEGIHEYHKGKIATFFADVLYRDWILDMLVKDLQKGKTFSEELTLEETSEIASALAEEYASDKVKELILSGNLVEKATIDTTKAFFVDEFKKRGSKKFFEVLKDELNETSLDVFVNIAGKQKYMAQNAEKLTNILYQVLKNPQAISQVPGVAKTFNELLENSGLSPIDFTQVTRTAPTSNQLELAQG